MTPLRIALIHHSARNDNLGVGALTVAEVAILRAIAHDHALPLAITVLDNPGPRPACVEGADVTVRTMRPLRRPWELFAALRAADLVIDIGGGDSFADIYGGKRLFRMLLAQTLTHLARRPLVFAPQTLGPFRSPLWRRIARASLARAALVATRDAASMPLLDGLALRRPAVLASDVALRLPFAAPPARPADGPIRVGLNVSGLLMNGGYTGDNMFGLRLDYPALVRAILARFQARGDCEIHLVGHVIGWTRGGVEDDFAASQTLAQEIPGLHLAPAFATPSEAKGYIAGLDFFMGARMHACIAALSAGVPVVPMAYSPKFAGLFGALGYGHTVDCTALDAGAVLARIEAAFENRAGLAHDARAATARGLDRLARYEGALADLLATLPRRPT